MALVILWTSDYLLAIGQTELHLHPMLVTWVSILMIFGHKMRSTVLLAFLSDLLKNKLILYRANGCPDRAIIRVLWVHVARVEIQVMTADCGRNPCWPKATSFANVHNCTITAVVSISVSRGRKEYCISRFPTIGIEKPTFIPNTSYVELPSIVSISTSGSKSGKCSCFWLNIPR